MPEIFLLFARYYWLIALIQCGFGVFAYRRRFRPFIAENPERTLGYQRFLIGYVLVNVLIWSLMGLGIFVGGLSWFFAFLDPSAGNPYVLAWHGIIIVLWLIAVPWIFLHGGMQFFSAHPGIINVNPSKPEHLSLWFGIMALGYAFAEIMIWTQGHLIAAAVPQ